MELVTFFIAGVQHHQLHRVLKDLKTNEILELVPEPINKFDPNAVRIEHSATEENIMCGYVPKKFSAEIAAMIGLGKHLICEIEELNKEAKPWEQCKVTIKEVKDA